MDTNKPDISPQADDTQETPRGKLECYNWLADIPLGPEQQYDVVEVQFKNTRKGYFRNTLHIALEQGDLVVVEAATGHDVGHVSLTGPLVKKQIIKAGVKSESDLKRVLRKARQNDINVYREAKSKENDTMIRARKIAEDLNLKMKIGDVEYQGDGYKAIFYYIADERVDFRQLIKVLADAFKVRIEMKQIGARQEAGRIGGIGPCGRPLCCSTWLTSFVSVGTAAARFQDISLNPQKLAGQCAKLKCCLNYEVDAYVEALKRLPGKDVRLETADNTYYHFKHDVFKGLVTYSTDKSIPANLVTIDARRAFEVIAMNKEGQKPMSLLRDEEQGKTDKSPYADLLDQDNISRFDNAKKKRNRKKKRQNKEESPRPAAEEQDKQPKPENNGPRRDSRNRRRNADKGGTPKQ